MRVPVHVGGRVLSCLDSAPAPSDVAQEVVPATPADASEAFTARNVLLLLHAFPLNAAMWEAQLASAPSGWRFLAPDMRGCGESEADSEPGSPDLSLDDYARDAVALLDHLRLHRVVVAGLSMGGYTAFALLRLAPARIAGLVLCNTKADADSEEVKCGRRDMLRTLDREGVAGVAEQMLPRLVGESSRHDRPQVMASVRAVAAANRAGGIRAAIIRMMNRPDSTPLLSSISCPTLVVASDEDAIIPVGQARTMRHAIPGSELAVIHQAGHLSNLEQPEQFTHTLRQFLTTRFRD